MGHVEGQPHFTFLTPDGTGSGSHGTQHEQLPASFQALTEQQPSPEMMELLSALYDTFTVQRQLEMAAQHSQKPAFPEPPHSFALERSGSILTLDPSVPERLTRASRFVEAAVSLMRGSFTAYPDDPAILRAILNAAYAPYGFQVAEGQGEISVNASRYHARIEQHIEQYAATRKAHHIPYGTLHFQIDDDYQWEPVGTWEEDPEVALLTDQMNHVRSVDERLAGLSQQRWFRTLRRPEDAEHVSGLQPYYRERYSQAQSLLAKAAEGVMQEGMRESSVYLNGYGWLHALVYTGNEALYDLDLHMDVNPLWVPEQSSTSLPLDTVGRIMKIEEIDE